MSSLIITLKSPLLPGAIDLELPGDVPMRRLLPELARALHLPPDTYYLARRSRVIRDDEALFDVHILMGDILTLQPAHAPPPPRTAPGHGATQYIGSALLTTASGRVIALNNFGKDELLIGRYDPRILQVPDIDMTGEPHGETVSRVHAMLRRQRNRWSIVALSTRNPTRVGSTPVPPQQSHPLTSGDVITLGGAKLTFT